MEMTRVALYARVSTLDKGQDQHCSSHRSENMLRNVASSLPATMSMSMYQAARTRDRNSTNS